MVEAVEVGTIAVPSHSVSDSNHDDIDNGLASPVQRPDSPSPSVSPSMALDAVPLLDRSVSTPSSTTGSTLSTRSRHSRLSEGAATVVRRRGYMRPQGTSFADSARNRDSVMSLGSIAHMQYYFARTGLLDGKGAQLAKEGRKKGSANADKENMEPSMSGSGSGGGSGSDDYNLGSPLLHDGQNLSQYAVSDPGADTALVESPTDLVFNSEAWDPCDPIMLPPTVSTYKVKPEYIEPLPDMPVLRRELKEALQDACKVLEESQKQENHSLQMVDENSGYHEIQGMHLLDIITLAIRAAKIYYTAHSNPKRLYAIKSEKIIRTDLYNVLDILKRMATRNFRGGIRLTELTGILLWIESIDKLLKEEDAVEQAEAAERESWIWREGDWTGRERERECLFMRSFDLSETPLPMWPEASGDQTLPNDFLRALQDGQRLVKLHNALVARSQRRFHEIKVWHTDVAKPYRMADNLRYWTKAAELRWDVTLDVPALDVVNGKDERAWAKFDQAVLEWCQGVRTELMEEWRLEKQTMERRRPPELKFEVSEDVERTRGEVETEAKAPVVVPVHSDTMPVGLGVTRAESLPGDQASRSELAVEAKADALPTSTDAANQPETQTEDSVEAKADALLPASTNAANQPETQTEGSVEAQADALLPASTNAASQLDTEPECKSTTLPEKIDVGKENQDPDAV